MGPTFLLSISFLLNANLNLAEQTKPVSQKDVDTLQMIRGIDKDMLKELTALVKAKKGSQKLSLDSLADSKGRKQRHGRKAAQKGSARRLQGRQLSEAAVILDTLWLLVCGTFVFFMHAGFAMLEAGTGRA